jgi:hypothetical protein
MSHRKSQQKHSSPLFSSFFLNHKKQAKSVEQVTQWRWGSRGATQRSRADSQRQADHEAELNMEPSHGAEPNVDLSHRAEPWSRADHGAELSPAHEANCPKKQIELMPPDLSWNRLMQQNRSIQRSRRITWSWCWWRGMTEAQERTDSTRWEAATTSRFQHEIIGAQARATKRNRAEAAAAQAVQSQVEEVEESPAARENRRRWSATRLPRREKEQP